MRLDFFAILNFYDSNMLYYPSSLEEVDNFLLEETLNWQNVYLKNDTRHWTIFLSI